MACAPMGLIHAEFRVVGRSEGRGVFGFVLLIVGLVDPCKRVHKPEMHVSHADQWCQVLISGSHVVESGRNISHQTHKEERNLQNLVGDEVQTLHERVIPGHSVEVDQKREDP